MSINPPFKTDDKVKFPRQKCFVIRNPRNQNYLAKYGWRWEWTEEKLNAHLFFDLRAAEAVLKKDLKNFGPREIWSVRFSLDSLESRLEA